MLRLERSELTVEIVIIAIRAGNPGVAIKQTVEHRLVPDFATQEANRLGRQAVLHKLVEMCGAHAQI